MDSNGMLKISSNIKILLRRSMLLLLSAKYHLKKLCSLTSCMSSLLLMPALVCSLEILREKSCMEEIGISRCMSC
jgi:hypothetical protein